MFYFNDNYGNHFSAIKSYRHKNQFVVEPLSGIQDIDFKHKSLVVLCGNDTKDGLKAAKYSRYFFDWIKDNPKVDKIDAYSIFYQNGQPLFSDLEVNPTFDYSTLSRTIFEPLLRDQDRLFTTDEICQKLGNIVFFGHSVGGLVMDELMKSLSSALKFYGFSKLDINKIFSSIVFIGYAPYKLTSAPIQSIYLTPLFDSVGSAKKALQKISGTQNIKSSIPAINLSEINMVSRNFYYEQFIDYFHKKLNKKTSIVLKNRNTIDIISDLLYYDGTREDHNLAGVIDYSKKSPYKTTAGEELTTIISNIFNYCFDTPRKEFSLNEIYSMATDPIGPTEKEQKINKDYNYGE